MGTTSSSSSNASGGYGTYPGRRNIENTSGMAVAASGAGRTTTTTTAAGGARPNYHRLPNTATAAAGTLPSHVHRTQQHQQQQQQASVPVPPVPNHASSANNVSHVRDNQPGAYCVSRSQTTPAPQIYRVIVPPGTRPRQDFQAQAGGRLVRVTCPRGVSPGQTLQISVTPENTITDAPRGMAPLTSSYATVSTGGAVPMRPDIKQWNEQHPEEQDESKQTNQSPSTSSQAYMVTIPKHVKPGDTFKVNVSGVGFVDVKCPSNARAGMNVRIQVPTPTNTQSQMQMFEVTVPQGVRPNKPFALMAAGQRVLVTCPPDAVPGQKIRFQLSLEQPKEKSTRKLNLSYNGDKEGWSRMIRVNDYKFTWVRTLNNDRDDCAAVDTETRFDRRKSAYCRNLSLMQGNDPRMRTGRVTIVPANEFAVGTQVFNENEQKIVSHTDFASLEECTYEQKCNWFYDKCKILKPTWEGGGHVCIKIRRNYLLEDSMEAVMSLGRADLRKIWRFQFIGEMGKDAGGLAREWFTIITQRLMDADFGLWLSSAANQSCMNINPASEISCPEDHLIYFRLLGRVMGKAIMDQQLVAGHMVPYLYKHLLGWPITFDDLETVDADLFSNLSKLVTEVKPEEVEYMCLDFTLNEETLGVTKQVDLIPNGSNVEVTGDNLPEYLEANLKYRMLERIKPQLTELLLGFYDVLPEPLLLVFDFHELELLMCGLPKIDMVDWMSNTNYSGKYSSEKNQTCQWFWEVVRNDFNDEMKARLLQFVTGTSGVPSRGFSVLQGNDGNIKKFTIHGIDKGTSMFPRAHTCFNRIDLPIYSSKGELEEKLRIAVTTSCVGFDME